MAVLTRTKIKAHLEKQARAGFLNAKGEYAPKRGAFCRDLPSISAFEIYTDMGDHPWPVQNAGLLGGTASDSRIGAPEVNIMSARESVTILGGEERALKVNNIDWDIAVGIANNAIDDATADLSGWAREAGQNYEAHKDYLAFDAMENGDGTTYGYCYDGGNFYQASHTDPGAEYQTAQDNEYGVTPTLTNFRTVFIAGTKFLDSRGQSTKNLSHDLILYPVDLLDDIAQIVRNPEKEATSNREVNPFVGGSIGLNALKVPGSWFSATTWVAVDPSHTAKPVYIQVRQAPELVTEVDEFGKNTYFIFHARYAVFYGDWRLAVLGNT